MSNEGKKTGRPLNAEEGRLWRLFSRDISPLDGEPAVPIMPEAPVPRSGPPPFDQRTGGGAAAFSPEIGLRARSEAFPPAVPATDRRTADKLRRGKMPVEATLDLHGMNQREAHERLHWFLTAARETGKRTVLVITGKGKRQGSGLAHWLATEPGVLRRKLPEWLSLSPLRDIVLDFCPAKARHGGEGAFYILLKRKR